eukprot:scaffold39158_cov165-Skeletonema_marinoi.AAC.2
MSDNNNASSSVGRDELAALLGASRASDLVAAANNDANKSLSAGLAPQSRRHNRKEDAEDVSKMDRAQAAALVAKKFGSGTQASSGAAGGVARHRASGKRKRQYQLLAGDLTERNIDNNAAISSMDVEKGIDDFYDKGGTQKEEEDKFTINKSVSGVGKRKKLQAKVLLKRGGDGNDQTDRRRRRHSDSSSASSTSSSSQSQSSSSSDDESRNRSSRRNRRRRSNTSSSSSSSSNEDEADLRRKRARAKAQRNQSEAVVVSVRGKKEDNTNDSSQSLDKLDAPKKSSDKGGNIRENDDDKKNMNTKHNVREGSFTKKKRHSASSRGSESSSSDDQDDSSTSSSSSSSSEDESDDNIAPMSVSKPLFVPKSKRGTVAEVEAQQRKLEEAEERRVQEKEKRAVQSRALVAETVSAVGKSGGSSHGIDDGDEFETGEVGGEFIAVPDDSDPVDEDFPELVLAERDAWEVRELIRILRDVDEAAELKKERKELERRRALTDEERLEEDRRSGRYRAPGEARRVPRDERHNGSKGENNYLQRYHHRGAFYLDDDTLNQAGENDVRHRALEYSRSATGDRVDKRSLPEVMQVKNFGLAGRTQYEGLSKEDTTDKKLDFLPIRRARAGTRDEKSGNNRYNQK